MPPRNVFTIPPGVPFLATFVEALLEGEIVESFSRKLGPLELAKATIYVPTQRAGRALAHEFAKAAGKPSALLPRILPLGGLDEQEASVLFESDDAFDDSFPPAIDELQRRLALAELVLEWARALEHAIVSIAPDGGVEHDMSESLLIAPSPVSAYALARELADLIDEFTIENIDWKKLDRLTGADYDRFWAITLEFLRIAREFWPRELKERGLLDAAQRRALLIRAQAARLCEGCVRDPVIAAGSTGANVATAELLAAIAGLENGAVVLPGLDRGLDDDAWRRIGYAPDETSEHAFTHPQAVLKRLLERLKIAREDVRALGAPQETLRRRAAFLSQAFRPADATDEWRGYRAEQGAGFAEALRDMAFVEAPDEREEALALALFMREALETPGKTAALVTPDREIARRVRAELERWNLEIDDSGGRPLGATPIGSLARLLALVAENGASALDVAALLAHPLARFDMTRARVEAIAPLLEIGVLRAVGRAKGGWAQSFAPARELASRFHAHPAVKRFSDKDWNDIEELLSRLDCALAPLFAPSRVARLGERLLAHRAALELVVGAASAGEGSEELILLFDKLAGAESRLAFDASSYSALFDRLAFETVVRAGRGAHPRLKILGLLEARLLEADVVLLAGLDETIWPPQAETGAFLNRSMRRELGLPPPERRIGQTAHDFQMAFGAREVVLSRAKKRGGSPTVASRFVSRIGALAGEAFLSCKARGDEKLGLAQALDRPLSEPEARGRPEPRPPVELRPRQLSVTRIETLRRDPYAIYAEHVLELVPFERLGAEKGAREIGTAIHAALAEFARAYPRGPLPGDARPRLLALAREALDGFLEDPAFLAFEWPRIEAGLGHALAFERERRETGCEIFVETGGAWRFPLKDGSEFILSAVADRIEIGAGGEAFVFDYKTGTAPTNKQVETGFSPQLTLEAAMIEEGAFKSVGERSVAGAAYVRLAAADGGARWLSWKERSFADVVAEHNSELRALLDQFREEATPYPSRPFVEFASRYGEYDHLARVKEWSRDGGSEEE